MDSGAESLTLHHRHENHPEAAQRDQSEMREASGAGEDELDGDGEGSGEGALDQDSSEEVVAASENSTLSDQEPATSPDQTTSTSTMTAGGEDNVGIPRGIVFVCTRDDPGVIQSVQLNGDFSPEKIMKLADLLKEEKLKREKQDVVYKIRYKTSTRDSYWTSFSVSESDYEKKKVEHSDSVLELRKDTYISNPAAAQNSSASTLRIASLVEETMIIHSPYLIDIMPKVVGYYPSSKTSGWKVRGGHRSIILSKPYRMLGGALPNLEKLRQDWQQEIDNGTCNKDANPEDYETKSITIKHIKYLESELNKVLKAPMEKERRGYTQSTPVASFDMLWLLFRPGTIVFTRIDDNPVCCRIRTPFWNTLLSGETDSVAKITLVLQMWFLDFTGTVVDRRSHSIRIDSFEGTRNIVDFEVYPLEYMKDQELRGEMLKRGKRYMEILRQVAPQCLYSGFVFSRQEDKTMKERHYYDGRVVVDPIFHYIEYGAPWGASAWQDKEDTWPSETSDGSMHDFVDIDPKKPDLKLTDDHFLLLTCYIRGFTLGTRKWVWLHIDDIHNYSPDKELIKSLQIDSKFLEMITSFVPQVEVLQRANDTPTKPLPFDPIKGKGEGRIMLLHGAPGTGKTFTAECMAEYSGRPLLRLSCGELGIDPTILESKLWKYFRMAEAWQGVLLIDEADVYLQQRTMGNSLEKDTIVAVFLRALEYYSGILFLTSNCVTKFDEAITSRVSLIIEFTGLSITDRKKLIHEYKQKILSDDRYDWVESAEGVLRVIENSPMAYNGREIKNLFQMALALATEDHRNRQVNQSLQGKDKPKDTVKSGAAKRIPVVGNHFTIVKNSIEDFMKSQRKWQGGKTNDQIAADDDRRVADSFGGE